jgi:hypothetical protein
MKRGQKNSLEGNNGLFYKKRRENERGKNRDKKIVMVKLIIQEEKKQIQQQQKVQSSLSKCPGLICLASNPGIGAWYSVLCGERCCPSCQTAGVETARGFYSFFPLIFLGVMGCLLQAGALMCLTRRLAYEQYLFPSAHRAVCNWYLG